MSGTDQANQVTMPATAARRPDARLRLIVALVVASLLAGFAVSSASQAAPPTCRIGDVLTKHRGYSEWSRSVLDTYYRLSSTYSPTSLRSTSAAGLNSGYSVRSFVISDLKAMASAARSAGARFAVQSAYRSYRTQKATFNYWVSKVGYAKALLSSARAGHSEHQLGTTLDLRSYGGSAPWNYKDWGTTKAGAWLKANAWKYGFVMTYPKGKTSVTCYQYEPWHYRYVGRDTARKVRASGLTLREYLWKQQTARPPSPTPTKPPTPTPTATPSPTAPPPTPTPTAEPTATPTIEPTATPDGGDDAGEPTTAPTATPTTEPTATPPPATPSPTTEPTATPTTEPTATPDDDPPDG